MNEQLTEAIKILSSVDYSLLPQPFYLDWGFWNVVVLFATLLSLLWYALETQQMKKQMIVEHKTNIRPIIICSFLKKEVAKKRMDEAKNLDGSARCNLYKPELLLYYYMHTKTYPISLNVRVEAVNMKNKKKIILREIPAMGDGYDEYYFFDENFNYNEYDFIISYDDVENNKHKTFFNMGSKGKRILKFE